jgi:hypothetical protein
MKKTRFGALDTSRTVEATVKYVAAKKFYVLLLVEE